MKQCTKCLELKDRSLFYKETNKPYGLQNHCKSCDNARKQAWGIKNPERAKQHQNKADANKYAKNKQKITARNRHWKRQNPSKIRNIDARRRSALLLRNPKWLTKDDLWLIEQAYEIAVLRTKMFGFYWHVDHVFPLQGKQVSGLHVPTNLQVIPARENLTKSNKMLTS